VANYFRRLISNKDVDKAVTLPLIALVLFALTYFLTIFVIGPVPAPLGSFEEVMRS
jgi:hypothetical protein